MISDEELEGIINSDVRHSALLVELAKELLTLRKAREGWKLVPVEATEEMIQVGDVFMDGLSQLGNAYEAMIAAAPEPE